MAERLDKAPENYFGIVDPAKLDELAGRLATRRLGELELGPPLTSFSREDLVWVHRYLLQDVHPWAGRIRTEEVGAMGMAMCRAQFVEQELDRVMRGIGARVPSISDREAAVATVADHWAELTLVHPFRDGNSRTQRFFFDQLLRSAGWAVDWTKINADEVHAARYVGAATADSAFLAEVLLPGVGTMDTASVGTRDGRSSAEIFRAMIAYRRSHPGAPWHAND